MVSLNHFLIKFICTLVVFSFVDGSNSGEYSKPEIGRVGKTRRAKMSTLSFNFNSAILFNVNLLYINHSSVNFIM